MYDITVLRKSSFFEVRESFCFFFVLFSASQNRSPSKSHNGRDNTESIDMEMSDEDFDTIPDFQSNFCFHIKLNTFIKFVAKYLIFR